jgi:hypothetical protein
MRAHWTIALASTTALLAAAGCSNKPGAHEPEALGEAEVSLTNSPSDVRCLRITVVGTRTDVRTFPVTTGQKAVFRMGALPVGDDSFSAEAFPVVCGSVTTGVTPTWISEPVVERVNAGKVTHVALAMIHNGGASVSVDFDDKNAPSGGSEPGACQGHVTAAPPYLVPVEAGIRFVPFLTVGESVNTKPDGTTPYRMVGIPDGLGVIDNGDDTFTLLSNHELGNTAGVARAHGQIGSFVSKWRICKNGFGVQQGEDLIQRFVPWNKTTSSYDPPTNGDAARLGRLCSADLAERSALFDATTGLGYDGDLFFDGEEVGAEGRGIAHGLDGTSWDLPRTGKFSWENNVPNPNTGDLTVVAGIDDSTPGEVYFYYGQKTNTGTPIEMAGLTNGYLYALRVIDFPTEPTTGIPSAPFDLVNHGNVENNTGAELQGLDNAANVTKFNRPEDGDWDPGNPNHFYFVTTASFSTPSRLWRVTFNDVRQPDTGGTIEMLLDGTEGQRMLDNITLDHYGHIYMQEDPGGQDHLAKVWRYDIQSDTLTLIAQHNPDLFTPGAPGFITNDEESSGITNAEDVLGPGWFLLDVQVHRNIASTEPELVEMGQYLAMYDPLSAAP